MYETCNVRWSLGISISHHHYSAHVVDAEEKVLEMEAEVNRVCDSSGTEEIARWSDDECPLGSALLFVS